MIKMESVQKALMKTPINEQDYLSIWYEKTSN